MTPLSTPPSAPTAPKPSSPTRGVTTKSSAMSSKTLRIAHLSDTHIGMENYGRVNPETGLIQRLHDFLASLDQAVEGAIASSVDLVVFAGDIYKTRDPTPTHQREFARRITRLAAHGIQTVIVAGNHDIPMSA